jgi:hypothetical protein
MGEMRNAYKILVGKHEGGRPLVSRCGWEDNIKLKQENRVCITFI